MHGIVFLVAVCFLLLGHLYEKQSCKRLVENCKLHTKGGLHSSWELETGVEGMRGVSYSAISCSSVAMR